MDATQAQPMPNAHAAASAPLESLLGWLDEVLERAVQLATAAVGPDAATDPYRGLHIAPEEALALAGRPAGRHWFADGLAGAPLAGAKTDPASPLGWLTRAYALVPFEQAVIVLCLAPEVDLKYERLCAFLQDDVTKRRPTIDLALNLFAGSAAAKRDHRRHFAPEAPLVRHRLVHLRADPHRTDTPLIAHALHLDGQLADLLLQQGNMDRRLAAFCRYIPADNETAEGEPPHGLLQVAMALRESGGAVRLYLRGPAGVGKRRATEVLARRLGMPILAADAERLADAPAPHDELLTVLFREAALLGALLRIDGVDCVRAERPALWRGLTEHVRDSDGWVVLTGHQPWQGGDGTPAPVYEVAVPVPGAAERRRCWEAALTWRGVALPPDGLAALAERFALTPGRIHAAAQAVEARLLAEPGRPPTQPELFAAARAQAAGALTSLVRRVEPVCSWDDLVLPDDTALLLRELCQAATGREQVLTRWGFGRKLARGRGVTALFTGPSGTGKTLAAEVVAAVLGVDLYVVNIATVVSKYIGETEKNLERVFDGSKQGVLFFDEADAHFGKRTEVRDAHDRYANLEISYLLQKMELYDGVAILATNLRQHLDDAFVRRLAFTVPFAFPDEAQRRLLWRKVWPRETPLAADVDLGDLARRFPLAGGNIKNIALAAAYLAAHDEQPVGRRHLLHAVRREYQKLGKQVTDLELYGADAGDGP